MADNVSRYRSLKWGDPEKKLKMLPPDEPRRSGGCLGLAVALLVATGVGFAGVAITILMWPAVVSAAAQTIQSAHADCRIKGDVSIDTAGRIYHVPGQPYYAATRISPEYGERCFCSEAEARRAGCVRRTIEQATLPEHNSAYGLLESSIRRFLKLQELQAPTQRQKPSDIP